MVLERASSQEGSLSCLRYSLINIEIMEVRRNDWKREVTAPCAGKNTQTPPRNHQLPAVDGRVTRNRGHGRSPVTSPSASPAGWAEATRAGPPEQGRAETAWATGLGAATNGATPSRQAARSGAARGSILGQHQATPSSTTHGVTESPPAICRQR